MNTKLIFRETFKAVRLKQWTKNILIFTPVFFANKVDYSSLIELSKIFFGFSVVVSSTYIFNDLKDIKADKQHPTKKLRPVANGNLSINYWKRVSFFLLIIGSYILIKINLNAFYLAIVYCILTMSYSIKLKYIKFIDLLSISILFSIRILIGGIVVSVPISYELGFFVFLSSLGIVSTKKLSILLDKNIPNTKIKIFLTDNYSIKTFKRIIIFSFTSSVLTYAYWIINTTSFQNLLTNVYYFISLVSLVFFKYHFTKESFLGNAEVIFNLVYENKKLRIYSVIFAISSFIVYL